MIVASTAAIALAGAPAMAGTSYTCSNAELLRVTCMDGACEAADSAILTVTIDGYDLFVVCGEALCWRGPGTRQVSGAYEIVTGVDLKWDMGSEGEPNDAVLAFDPKTGTGTILAPPFYSPIRCMVHPGE